MEYSKLVMSRYSCRKYDEAKKVKIEDIDRCVALAINAPSARNRQPWKIVAVTNDEVVAKVSKATQMLGLNKFTDKSSAFVIIVEDSLSIVDKATNALTKNEFAPMDVGQLTAYLTLALTDCGIGSCILGCFDEAKVKQAIGQRDGKKVKLVLALGYPQSADIPAKTRKSLDEVYSKIV